MLVAGSLSHSSWLTSGGRLCAFGYNEYGQLALGTTSNQKSLQEVTSLSSLSIKQIASGYKHSLALTTDGKVFTFGANEAGQLGIGSTEQKVRPVEVTALSDRRIVAVAAGSVHSLALSDDGKVFSWGSNELGQLGIGNTVQSTSPQLVQALSKKTVSKVAAGYEHSVVLTVDGQVFSWGNNHAGQLGIGSTVNQDGPQVLPALALSTAVNVYTGYAQTIIQTDEGELLICGLNQKGQLGLGHGNSPVATPAKLPLPGKVTSVGAGNSHFFFLLEDGRLFGCGMNGYGEIGVTGGSCITVPLEMTWAAQIGAVEVVAGWQHNLVKSKSGDLFSWGRGDFGQLGVDKAFLKTPVRVEGVKVDTLHLLAAASSARSGVIDSSIHEETETLALPSRADGKVTFIAHQADHLVGPGEQKTVVFTPKQ